MLAVALTSLLLLVVDPGAAATTPDAAPGAGAVRSAPDGHAAGPVLGAAPKPASGASPTPTGPDTTADTKPPDSPNEVAKATTEEAKRAFSNLGDAAVANLPKLALVCLLLLVSWLTVRALRFVLRHTLRSWSRSSAVAALSAVAVWVLALGVSVTIIAGDVRAFLGSVGLVGLAASWALQTPIESFTGWLLNAFRGHYRVGDRIEVGDVFGDVHRIDVLTTTVWEIGSPFRPGFIRAEQPTGRLITFPNNQILTGSVVNYTRDLPYLWDEVIVAVANESELRYAMRVVQGVAIEVFGDSMQEPARQYEQTLQRAGFEETVPPEPQVFVSVEDSWTNLHVRYLVHARQRRRHKSELVVRLSEALNLPEHAGRIISVVPREQLQFIGSDGRPRNADWFSRSESSPGDDPEPEPEPR